MTMSHHDTKHALKIPNLKSKFFDLDQTAKM